jgi:hypothetical protein
MDVMKMVRVRVKMLGGVIDEDILDWVVKKSMREAMDFCNVNEFGDEAEFYLTDWAAANYLTETEGYSKQWERMRHDAEAGLIKFRRFRW